MFRFFFTLVAILAVVFCPAMSVAIETVSTMWGGDAEKVYDSGFMHMLMKHPDGGVCLFDMNLIENDGPGAGRSLKGVYSDVIWGKNRARKILFLDDPRAYKAWFVMYFYHQGKYPLQFTVNGHSAKIDTWDLQTSREMYRWEEFPVEWLRKGKNVIELLSPEAVSEAEGWELYIARADEFEAGGGDPVNVGKTSFKSSDGGETWKESPFGPLGKVQAEYTVRLSLDRYVKTGWLASPVIDLWKGDSEDFIVPLREIKKMNIRIRAEVPNDTKIEYYLRKGTDSDPFSVTWGPYQLIGEGASLDFETGGADLNRRYVQLRAVLSTSNPLKSPVVKSARVTAELLERVPLPNNIFVVEFDNPLIKYSSIDWQWEKWDRPEFKELRELENLDEVIAVSRTEFDAQVKLLDYVTKRWRHQHPMPGHPGWDALSIINRINKSGGGGMCIQFNNTLAGFCMAYGWQGRLVNVTGHEVCEVWNDEYGKWIYLDADYKNHYNYDIETCEPQSMLDLHRKRLDYSFPGHTIDWMNEYIPKYHEEVMIEGKLPPVKRGSLTHHTDELTGFNNASSLRMVPRNNWYEKPYPRPLNHGITWWAWNGYINWYDDRTPPRRQYSWFTDRPRDMWPDLNRVFVDATSGFGNDRLFLRFETYTPNFCHFEVDVDDTGWKKVGARWTWLLQSGRNTLRVRAVNKLGAGGKPSSFVVNHADAPFGE